MRPLRGPMARLIRLKEFETEGERSTAGTLAAGLPEEWVVIYSAMLVGFGGVLNQVDFFVVGDHGVYLVDDKSFNGKVVAGRGNWETAFGSVENPVEKAEMVARKAAGQIREGVGGVGPALGGAYFLHAYISLSGQVDLVPQDPHSTARVVLASQLCQALAGFDRLADKQALPIADFRDGIVDYLTAGRPGIQPADLEPDAQLVKAEVPVRLAAPTPTPPANTPRASHRRPILRWIPVACLLALVAVFALAYWSSRPVKWDEARAQVGKTTTVYGPVVQSTKKPNWGGLSYINIGRDFRPGSATPFYLRIDPGYRAAVEAELRQLAGNSPSPWDAYGTKTIWVRARVLEDRYGGAYALVTSARDIQVGVPSAQSGYLLAACAALAAAIIWAVVLLVMSARHSRRSASIGENAR